MRPSLFEIAGEPVPAYFTLLCIGFALATWFCARWAKRSGVDHEAMIDLGLLMLITGVAGARIMHVIADGYFWNYVHLCTDPALSEWKMTKGQCVDAEWIWDATKEICRPKERDCFAWAAFWRGGLTYYGGLIVAIPAGAWLMRRENIPVLKVCDIAGASVPIGLVWGRMGCFLGGCCYGQVTDDGFPLAVRFPAWSAASEGQFRAGELVGPHLESLSVHPTQLYEAIGCLLIGMFLTGVALPKKRFDGMVILLFLGLYAVLRFAVEFWRADDRGEAFSLSTSQLLSLGALALVAVLWPILLKRSKSVAASAAPSGHSS